KNVCQASCKIARQDRVFSNVEISIANNKRYLDSVGLDVSCEGHGEIAPQNLTT
ncbi:MAG: hypothetical protein ACI8PB_003730, partial [Desulforhopalus sp.]